jgi:hypothetical protein
LPIKNFSTKVSENKTVAEIQDLLARKGANAIQIEYANGRPQALKFVIEVDKIPVPFRLPCNFDGVRRALAKNSKTAFLAREEDRYRRIAWRIVKDWIDAQMALIEAEQAALAEIFLPYVVSDSGRTLYLHWKENMLPVDRQLAQKVGK